MENNTDLKAPLYDESTDHVNTSSNPCSCTSVDLCIAAGTNIDHIIFSTYTHLTRGTAH